MKIKTFTVIIGNNTINVIFCDLLDNNNYTYTRCYKKFIICGETRKIISKTIKEKMKKKSMEKAQHNT